MTFTVHRRRKKISTEASVKSGENLRCFFTSKIEKPVFRCHAKMGPTSPCSLTGGTFDQTSLLLLVRGVGSGPAVIGAREASAQFLIMNFIKSSQKWCSQNRTSRTGSYAYDYRSLDVEATACRLCKHCGCMLNTDCI